MAKREAAEIFFEDESGVRSDFHSGTTWAPRGKTPVVRVTGQRTLVHGPRDLHRAVVGRLRYLQKSPEIVRSFFQAPDTCYAAAA